MFKSFVNLILIGVNWAIVNHFKEKTHSRANLELTTKNQSCTQALEKLYNENNYDRFNRYMFYIGIVLSIFSNNFGCSLFLSYIASNVTDMIFPGKAPLNEAMNDQNKEYYEYSYVPNSTKYLVGAGVFLAAKSFLFKNTTVAGHSLS